MPSMTNWGAPPVTPIRAAPAPGEPSAAPALPSAAALAEIEQQAAEAREAGTTPIVDAGLVENLRVLAEKYAAKPVELLEGLEQFRREQTEAARAQIRGLELSSSVEGHQTVMDILNRRAAEAVSKAAKAAESMVVEEEAKLRQILGDIEVAEQALNPRSQYMQRLVRVGDEKAKALDARLRYVNDEAGVLEMIRQASSARNTDLLAFLYFKVDGNPDWKAARRAIGSVPCLSLQQHEESLKKIKGRVQFALRNVEALKLNKSLSSTDLIAYGESQGQVKRA